MKSPARIGALDLAVAGTGIALSLAIRIDLSGMYDLAGLASGSPQADVAHKAEVARLARESELKRVALDRYMESRDATDAETSKEWVQKTDPLSQDPVARALWARSQDGDVI